MLRTSSQTYDTFWNRRCCRILKVKRPCKKHKKKRGRNISNRMQTSRKLSTNIKKQQQQFKGTGKNLAMAHKKYCLLDCWTCSFKFQRIYWGFSSIFFFLFFVDTTPSVYMACTFLLCCFITCFPLLFSLILYGRRHKS